jgi:hypothetical protein
VNLLDLEVRMSSYDEQEGDQFKLISLEGGNSIKPGAQKAKQAYSSYLKDDTTASSTAPLPQIDEEPPPAPVAKKAPTKPLPAPVEQKPVSVVNKPARKPYYSDGEESSDNIENVNQKIDELKESLANLWSNFISTISALFLKIGAILIRPLVLIASIMARILSVPLQICNRMISALADKMGVRNREVASQEEFADEAPPEVKTSNFSEMIDLNIIFTDNYKKNLYNKPKSAGFKLSKMEEALIINMAIEAIKECAEFTAELPPPSTGPYAGTPVSKIMEDATEEDINVFLGFVKAFPGKYIGKSWKISETFATWLINNSPTG